MYKIDFHPKTTEHWEISPGVLAPFWATPEAARLGLYFISEHRLAKRLICVISTGIGIKMPPGHFGLIKECSRLALKGICVLGGVMDPDYQEEIQVILQNEGKDDLFINQHDQIAQLLILPCVIVVVSSLNCVWFFVDLMDCSLPGSSVHGISQARIKQWVAISSSRGSSCISGGFFTDEPPGKPFHV